MSEPPAPFKKKSPKAMLPRALDEGMAPRPLFPAHRVAIPIGLVAIGAITFLEVRAASVSSEACASSYKPSIFERGAEAAKEAFERVMGRAYTSPGHGTPTVAGAMAVMPGSMPTTTGPLSAPYLGGPEPLPTSTTGTTSPTSDVTDATDLSVSAPREVQVARDHHLSPTRNVRPAGRPANPSPTKKKL